MTEPSSLGLEAWVLSLPWVVERPKIARRSGVRLYAVSCPLLRRRRVWLMTGLMACAGPGTTAGPSPQCCPTMSRQA
jgi:hypothetical protein